MKIWPKHVRVFGFDAMAEKFTFLHVHLYPIFFFRKQGFRTAAGRGGWIAKADSGPTVLSHTYTVNFWCLNPAVAFDDMKGDIRSIILTSGEMKTKDY